MPLTPTAQARPSDPRRVLLALSRQPPQRLSPTTIELLKYMCSFVTEALCQHTAVGRGHSAKLPLALHSCGKEQISYFPAGNRSMELWGEDAGEFNPDSWEKPIDNSYANLTCLSGPRGCIGSPFAKVEFKCWWRCWSCLSLRRWGDFKGGTLESKGTSHRSLLVGYRLMWGTRSGVGTTRGREFGKVQEIDLLLAIFSL